VEQVRQERLLGRSPPTASFTVPAVGSTVVVNVSDTSWIAVGEWIYAEDANGAGQAGLLLVTAKTSTTVTLKNEIMAVSRLSSRGSVN